MSDYADDINTSDYTNKKPVYVQEIAGVHRTYIPIKFDLDYSNFNFDTILSDGLDFRLAEAQGGTSVLKMWVAHWDSTARKATLYFRLPELSADQSKTLWAFWGRFNDSGISDINPLIGQPSDDEIVFTDNLAEGISTSGTSPEVTDPDYCFDGLVWQGSLYSDVPVGKWLQGNFTTATHVYKLRIAGDGTGFYGTGFQLRASNDNFVSENVLLMTDTYGQLWTWREYTFPNYTTYSGYRIVNTGTDTWRITEVEMMGTVDAVPIENPAFLFGDDFEGTELDFNKWPQGNGTWTISNSRISLDEDAVIQSINVVMSGTTSWVLEEGIYCSNSTDTTNYAHGYDFEGGENEFRLQYFWNGGVDRKHDVVDSTTLVTYDGVDRGLETGSYSQNYVAYVEDTDYVYQGMSHRDNLLDYNDSWERAVHRNTEIGYFLMRGSDTASAQGVEVDWVIVREYSPETDPTVDISELYLIHEDVPVQALDFTEYQDDVTSVDFYHSSDVGGDPYRLSDNIVNSASNIWISDVTTSGELTIDFGRMATNQASDEYIHFDSDHIEYYNASKLSDSDEDIHGRSWWEATTTSGWAAIWFDNAIALTGLSVWGLASKLDGMIKDYGFYGTNTDPRLATYDDKQLLVSGTFGKTTDEQTTYFTTAGHLYIYYILEVANTYGDDIALREWGMFEESNSTGKKAISQLRLYPAAFGSNEYFFPKNIKLYGSNDYFNWVELMDNRTYTPFYDGLYGRWQRYSFNNTDAYYAYKLVCTDNWRAATDIMKMAEWEMREPVTELDNYRVLEGSSNSFGQIWAEPDTTFVSGTIYMTNNKLNVVYNDSLANTQDITGDIADMNVK